MKKGKKRNLLVVIASAIVAVFIAVGAAVHANEITTISGLSGSNATVTNSQGQEVDPADLPDDGWTGYNVGYNWSIPDSTNVADGDTATVTLPTGMIVNQDMTGVVKNSQGEVVGNVEFTKGSSTGIVTFNDKLTGQYGKHGTLSVTAVKKAKPSSSTTSESAVGGGTINNNPDWGINKAGWIDQGAEKNGVPTKIYWDIVINPQGNSLKDVKVTDTLGDGQTYDNDSVTFHSVEYQNGQESPVTGTVPGTATVNGNTIIFDLGDIDTPVEIEYETTITNINPNGGNLWSNKATVTTTTPNIKWSRSTDSATVNWGTGGTAQSYAGKIEITKVDSVNNTKVLPGAVFELENLDHQVVKTNLVTGSNGKVAVDDLPDGQYYLVEIKAPTGYQLSSTPIEVVISNSNNHTAKPVIADKLAFSSSNVKSSSRKSSSSSSKISSSSMKSSSRKSSSSSSKISSSSVKSSSCKSSSSSSKISSSSVKSSSYKNSSSSSNSVKSSSCKSSSSSSKISSNSVKSSSYKNSSSSSNKEATSLSLMNSTTGNKYHRGGNHSAKSLSYGESSSSIKSSAKSASKKSSAVVISNNKKVASSLSSNNAVELSSTMSTVSSSANKPSKDDETSVKVSSKTSMISYVNKSTEKSVPVIVSSKTNTMVESAIPSEVSTGECSSSKVYKPTLVSSSMNVPVASWSKEIVNSSSATTVGTTVIMNSQSEISNKGTNNAVNKPTANIVVTHNVRSTAMINDNNRGINQNSVATVENDSAQGGQKAVQDNKSDNSKGLPQTGETFATVAVGLGIVLIVISGVIVFEKKN